MTRATDIIAAETEAFAGALCGPDPAAPVPTCPEWTAIDLLWHLTEVQEFWAHVLSSGARTDEDVEKIEAATAPRPEGPGARNQLFERREAATAALLAQLSERGDAEPAWSWFGPDQSVGFTRRMQTHEATLHRVDAQMTANEPVAPIANGVARDGLDHAVSVMWAGSWEWIPEWARTESLAVLSLEPEGAAPLEVEIARWSGTRPRDGQELSQLLARPLPEGAPPVQAGGDGGAAGGGPLPRAVARGSAAALHLWVWGRAAALEQFEGGPQRVELTGDDEAVRRVRERIAQGMD
jgi:uncharacterized protein (TIGR03083 family)